LLSFRQNATSFFEKTGSPGSNVLKPCNFTQPLPIKPFAKSIKVIADVLPGQLFILRIRGLFQINFCIFDYKIV